MSAYQRWHHVNRGVGGVWGVKGEWGVWGNVVGGREGTPIGTILTKTDCVCPQYTVVWYRVAH